MTNLTKTLILLVFVAGCTPMTNDEVIAETKKCEDAGMRAVLGRVSGTGYPVRVVCVPRDCDD